MIKEIKSIVCHIHGTQEEWDIVNTYVPMNSQIIVYDEDSNYPYKRFKIGDGTTTVGELPFSDAHILSLIQELDNSKLDTSNLTSAINTALEQAKNSGEFDGANGITFVPKISAKGDLSWTNDGELPNPPPVNIMGFVYKGMNPLSTKGLDQDIPAHWAGAGSGYWWISGGGNLKEQPNDYGFLFSLVYGSGECFQCLFCPAVNNIYIRSGGAGTNNSDGWYRNDNNSYIWKYVT